MQCRWSHPQCKGLIPKTTRNWGDQKFSIQNLATCSIFTQQQCKIDLTHDAKVSINKKKVCWSGSQSWAEWRAFSYVLDTATDGADFLGPQSCSFAGSSSWTPKPKFLWISKSNVDQKFYQKNWSSLKLRRDKKAPKRNIISPQNFTAIIQPFSHDVKLPTFVY